MNNFNENRSEITKLLKSASSDSQAMDNLIPYVYDEIKRQAHNFLNRDRQNHTLQTTALVHEAYLRLIEQDSTNWQNRTHLFALSATMMRRILVNYAKIPFKARREGRKSAA